ncbi:MAG: response regulator transcription factor [Cyanobacterium sp. T60_A2020_053]|nr:response regulator transcription factor [Cyanobacterium sp. T60_A2020_053]
MIVNDTMRALLVEDDRKTASLIQSYLTTELETVDIIESGEKIIELIETNNYDLLILDVLLQKKNGIDICREIRQAELTIKILFVTALQSQQDKIRAFESGADDYLIKPFDFQELLLRVKALINRQNKAKTQIIKWENIVMDLEKKEVQYLGKTMSLTPTEFDILQTFLQSPRQVFEVDHIIDKIWNMETIPTHSTFRSHIKSLRRKIEQYGGRRDTIQTVYGMGYRLCELENSSSIIKNETLSQKGENNDLDTFIAELWAQSKPEIEVDFNILNNYINKIDSNIDQETAVRVAHNLIGFLGNIGFDEVSRNFRIIEQNLKLSSFYEQFNKIEETINLLNINFKILFEDNNLLKSISNDGKQYHILWLENDINLINEFEQLIRVNNLNFKLSIISDLYSLENYHHDILIWGDCEYCAINKEEMMNKLTTLELSIAPVIYTCDDSLENRLFFSQQNIKAFFTKKIAPSDFLQYIKNELEKPIYISEKLYNILIIDDDERFIKTVSKKLIKNKLPLNIYTCSNPLNFLAEIEQIKPNLIILDLQMPKLNGLDICSMIKQDNILKMIPVIFLTGYLEPEIINQFVAVGADDFVSKSKIDLELYPRIMHHLQY